MSTDMLSKAFLLLIFMTCPAWAEWEVRFPADVAFILPTSSGKEMLKQCSRSTPQNVSAFWQPTAEQIAQLESLLPSYLSRREETGAPVPPKFHAYHRQYVGVVRGNNRLIYGNFYTMRETLKSEAITPVLVCDGGPTFWGIVFDPSTNQFEPPDFNGLI